MKSQSKTYESKGGTLQKNQRLAGRPPTLIQTFYRNVAWGERGGFNAYTTAIPALLLSTILLSPILSANTLQEADDFSEIAQNMQQSGKPLVLAFDAEHCHYCARLQADHLDPMLMSNDYQHVVIRSLEFDGEHEITDFDGQTIAASEFSERYKVRLTPTLLFLNAEGKEIAKRMLGYNTPEFYGAYLDRAIDKAVARMKNGRQPTEEAAQPIKTIE